MPDSRTTWMKAVPKEWRVTTIGSLYTLRNEKVSDKDYPPLSVTMKGIVPQLESAAKTEDGDNRKLVRIGDFAINSRSDRRGSCGISAYDGSVSLINTVLIPREKMHPGYYNWLFHSSAFSDEFYKWGHGIVDDLWTTRWQEMKRIVVPVPPMPEQEAIAAYLDEQCILIDATIAEAKCSIEDYRAWRASIIFEAVTKGLDNDAKLIESGIDGLGKIHASSRIIKLRHLIENIESGVSVNAGQDAARGDEIGVLKTSCVSKNKFIAEENKNVNREEYSRVACPVKGNSLIVSRMNTPELVGACGYVDKDYPNLFLPDRLWQITCLPTCNTKYVWYFLSSKYTRNYYASLATGTSSSMQNISQAQFGNLRIALPNIEEQERIAKYLDAICEQIDAITENTQALIANLESYKRSLIFEVVTGKRKVVQ